MGFPRQENWIGLPLPSQGSSQPRDEPMFPALAGRFLTTEPPGEPVYAVRHKIFRFLKMFSKFYIQFLFCLLIYLQKHGSMQKNYSKNWGWNVSCNKLWEALNAVVEVWTCSVLQKVDTSCSAWYFLMPVCVCLCAQSCLKKFNMTEHTHTYKRKDRKYQATTMCQSPLKHWADPVGPFQCSFFEQVLSLHFECPSPSLQWFVYILSIDSHELK